MLHHLILKLEMIISDLVNTQVTYVRLYPIRKNNFTGVYQWDLGTHKIFLKIKWINYSKVFDILTYAYIFLILKKFDWKYEMENLDSLWTKQRK